MHLDGLVVKIAGRSFWLCRAVDQRSVVLEEILQSRRDKRREAAIGQADTTLGLRALTDRYVQITIIRARSRLALIIGHTRG